MTVEKLNGGTIEQGVIKISVNYKGKTTTFVWSSKSSGTYNGAMKALKKAKLLMPTTAQTILLLDFALKNKENSICADILSKLKNKYLWTCTENFYAKGRVYLYDNPKGELNPDDEDELREADARPVPYGFKLEDQSLSVFEKNPYILAQVGNDPELAKMAAEVAKTFDDEPYVWALSSATGKRYSALGSLRGGRLYVGGSRGARFGYVFGVLE